MSWNRSTTRWPLTLVVVPALVLAPLVLSWSAAAGLAVLGAAAGASAVLLPGRNQTTPSTTPARSDGITQPLHSAVLGAATCCALGVWAVVAGVLGLLVVVAAGVPLLLTLWKGPVRRPASVPAGRRGVVSPLPAPTTGAPFEAQVSLLRARVAGWSDDQLCTAWRVSYSRLVRAVDDRARFEEVLRRQVYLDEIEGRYPDGFAAWMATGARAASDPGRYLTTDR